jgi:hypothetical protein
MASLSRVNYPQVTGHDVVAVQDLDLCRFLRRRLGGVGQHRLNGVERVRKFKPSSAPWQSLSR